MEVTQEMFNAKLNELSESYERMQQQIAHIQNADPDEVRQIRTHLEAEWADTVVELKNRAKMMRFLTAQQLSQVQMEYCRKAADILHASIKQSWSAFSTGDESDDMALYAEYAIDFATLAIRYALMSVASAVDVQNEDAKNNNDKEESK